MPRAVYWSTGEPSVLSRTNGVAPRSDKRCSVSETADRLTVVSVTLGDWPRGSTNRRVSNSTRGTRFGIASFSVTSCMSESAAA